MHTNRLAIPQGLDLSAGAMVSGETPERPCAWVGSRTRGPAHETAPAPPMLDADLAEAQAKAALCERFLALMRTGQYTLAGAAKLLGKPPSTFSGQDCLLARYLRGGLAALTPPRREPAGGDLSSAIEAIPWFVPAAKFFYLNTNATADRGSLPAAVRRTISLPNLPVGWHTGLRRQFLRAIQCEDPPSCPADVRDAILARQAAGKPLVPPRISRQIAIPRAIVRQRRNPKSAQLDFLNASGSLFFFTDPITHERRPPAPGEVIEADDATINFPVCVPWSLGGDPCSDKYGVKVGRFQWLVAIDAARRFVSAWAYVMRPRSSYRAEDILSLLRCHVLQHGIPLVWRLERGAWHSRLVRHAIQHMGSHLHTVWSPHQKPFIEGLFNTLWTKLSVHFPNADVGRYQGETEEANRLLTACKSGAKDPRNHFPMLADVCRAFADAIHEKNHTPVDSAIGRWIPDEAWASQPKRPRLDPSAEWLFAPVVREWTVRGMLVGGRVPLFEDLSVPFDFSADWLPHFDGAKVRCHFDPAAPDCQATLVLLSSVPGHRPGEVLGTARQINEVAGYARLALGWANDPRQAGRLARQQAASALRREVRAVTGPGQPAIARSEERDGIATATTLDVRSPNLRRPTPAEAPQADPSADPDFQARLRALRDWETEHALDFI